MVTKKVMINKASTCNMLGFCNNTLTYDIYDIEMYDDIY